jgi:cytidyltransferase-like protein
VKPPVEVGKKPPDFEAKIRDPGRLEGWIDGLARPLVFTNGVFDLLHRGHVTYLARARALGASLLVALNQLEDRLAVLAALECVDAVTWFDHDTPEALIAACRPQVLVKGGDWPVERIVGAGGVQARGGKVVSIPFEHERSTTALLEKIRKG